MNNLIRVGQAGWSNPPSEQRERPAGHSHLTHYAARFTCVEINSSFYRAHRAVTYERWREATPDFFRFSVKMPRSITHECALRGCKAELESFVEGIGELQAKLGAILVQLPPSLEFDRRSVSAFFSRLARRCTARVVCEPRHPSWFTTDANAALAGANVSRVAADPACVPEAAVPAGDKSFAYFRWHGSPHMYYSAYSDAQLTRFATAVLRFEAQETWCIFDNTARYAAWDDARRFGPGLRAAAHNR